MHRVIICLPFFPIPYKPEVLLPNVSTVAPSESVRRLRLVPPPEPTELTRLAREDADLLAFLRLTAQSGSRERAARLLAEAIAARPC
jgi:hypothetical protein